VRRELRDCAGYGQRRGALAPSRAVLGALAQDAVSNRRSRKFLARFVEGRQSVFGGGAEDGLRGRRRSPFLREAELKRSPEILNLPHDY